MQQIFENYLQSRSLHSLAEQLRSKKNHLAFKSLIGSSQQFVISALHRLSTKPFLVIANNFVDAAYIQNDLQNILSDQEILFFPSSLKTSFLTGDVKGVDSPSLLLRTEVLNKIAHSQANVIVSYPSAVIETVVNKTELKSNSIEINVGDSVDIETLVEFLTEYNFQQVDFVFDPGQFAVRGGIVDIFSFDSQQPYRIEFFGDEVESIRIFDIETQLSQQKVQKINIVPDLHTKEESKRISFFEFLPKDFVIIFSDLQFFLQFVEKNSDRRFNLEDDQGQQIIIQYDNFDQIKRQITQFSTIELSNYTILGRQNTVKFSVSPQPSFHKNFSLLVDNLRKFQELTYKIFILSSQKKQIQRIREILDSEEIGGKDIQFTPVDKTLHQGFIDHDHRLVVYTDHQIFGRYHHYRIKDEKLRNKKESVLIKDLQSLKPGDYVVHIDYGIGQFAGLMTIENNGKRQ